MTLTQPEKLRCSKHTKLGFKMAFDRALERNPDR